MLSLLRVINGSCVIGRVLGRNLLAVVSSEGSKGGIYWQLCHRKGPRAEFTGSCVIGRVQGRNLPAVVSSEGCEGGIYRQLYHRKGPRAEFTGSCVIERVQGRNLPAVVSSKGCEGGIYWQLPRHRKDLKAEVYVFLHAVLLVTCAVKSGIALPVRSFSFTLSC